MDISKTGISKHYLFLYITELLIVGQIFQYFTKLTHIPTFWPSILGLLLFTIVINPKVLVSDSVIVVILLFILLLFYDYFGLLKNIPKVVLTPFGVFSIVFPYFVIALVLENFLLLKNEDISIIPKVGKFSIFIIVISVIVNIISEKFYPGITRSNLTNFPNWVSAVSFGAFYSLPFLLISIIIYMKSSKYLILIVFLFSLLTIIAGFTTALVLIFLSLLIGFLIRYKVKQIILILTFLFLIAYYTISNISFFVELLPLLPHPAFKAKAEEISKLSQISDNAELLSSFRYGVYDVTIETIKKYPLFGSGDYDLIGQHSFWLDKIGFMGIVGFFAYLLIFFTFYIKAKQMIYSVSHENYSIIVILVFVFLFMNPIYWTDFWLIIFIVIPSIIEFLSQNRKGIDIHNSLNL